jgi:cell division protein FtsW (lipid II flippase)
MNFCGASYDFIFSVIGEEFGFEGLFAPLGAFFYFFCGSVAA